MSENYLIFMLVGFIMLLLGAVLGIFWNKIRSKSEIAMLEKQHIQGISQLEKNIQIKQNEIENLKIEWQKDLDRWKEKWDEEKSRIKEKDKIFHKEFENLANKILEEKTNKFTIKNKENIEQILNPLQERLLLFEKKIEETHKESIDRHAALRQQILSLKELNEQMSKEAVNLTKALKGDSKTQGNWGELILERVLEKSGLEKGREYEMEKSFNVSGDENRIRLRPDVIIHLPDNKKMIVDSKVSLTAYERYVNSEDEKEKEQALKEHINSINRHVEQLSAKKYEDLYEIESPDFVLLFIPVEPAFALAINTDNELYNKAFSKNIVIVTPSTLLATLRTIDSMWNNEKQQRNAIEIAKQAGDLYDKFSNLVDDLIKVGKKIDDAKKDYGNAMNKLVDGKGNLISRVERIKKLGIKAKKSLPQQLVERADDE